VQSFQVRDDTMPSTPSAPRRPITRTAFASLAVVIVGISPASAYIDPGTGSMLLQLLAAGVVGTVFYLRRWGAVITAWLFGRQGREGDERTEDPPKAD
jgi:hypothetical protein